MKQHFSQRRHRFFLLRTINLVWAVLGCGTLLSARISPQMPVSVELQRCFQTTGQGNGMAPILLLTVQNHSDKALRLAYLDLAVPRDLRKHVRLLGLYTSPTPEFYAQRWNEMLGALRLYRKYRAMLVNDIDIPAGSEYRQMSCMGRDLYIAPGTTYLWLTADVRAKAELGYRIDADVLMLRFLQDEETLSVRPVTKGAGYRQEGVQVFAVQSFVYTPTADSCRFYRIPAMILDAQGNIVVAADRRYASNADLGRHKIDVAIRRSTDGGRHWTPQQLIAVGDGVSDRRYGYGDAVLVRADNGDILCLMAASGHHVFQGIRSIALVRSTDGGQTWTPPRDITQSHFTDAVHNLTDSVGFFSLFCASGRALCTADGTLMVAASCIKEEGGRTFDNYILSSFDDGHSWTLGPSCAFRGGDESKLIQMNDGTMRISTRKQGKRGFNRTSSDVQQWGKQWEDSILPAHACNADILYYSRHTEEKTDIMLHTAVMTLDRKGLQLWMSVDEGQSWHPVMTIQKGSAAYSTMERLPNGDVAILYEDGSYSAGNGYHINFITITEKQLVDCYKALKQTKKSKS